MYVYFECVIHYNIWYAEKSPNFHWIKSPNECIKFLMYIIAGTGGVLQGSYKFHEIMRQTYAHVVNLYTFF